MGVPCSAKKLLFCEFHHKPYVYYCDTHETLVCLDCALIGKHKGHSLSSIDDAVTRVTHFKVPLLIQEVENRLENLRKSIARIQKSREQNEKSISHIENSITNFRRTIELLLQERCRSMMDNSRSCIQEAQIFEDNLHVQHDKCLQIRLQIVHLQNHPLTPNEMLLKIQELTRLYATIASDDSVEMIGVPTFNVVPNILNVVQNQISQALESLPPALVSLQHDGRSGYIPHFNPQTSPSLIITKNGHTAQLENNALKSWCHNAFLHWPGAAPEGLQRYFVRLDARIDGSIMVGFAPTGLASDANRLYAKHGYFLFFQDGCLYGQNGITEVPYLGRRVATEEVVMCEYNPEERTVSFAFRGQAAPGVAYNNVRPNIVPAILFRQPNERVSIVA
eukprot:TRINITY_DN3449_c0_g1_i4.p1 TRINITY_DN3449_c0_g1~~TRINITY_DN3449_c0_g1_i4.p1  ORF type:complete len:400 (-),score=12.94 TRINITY_DN3449_c0_g1_i4:171-1346(-)